MYPAIAPAITTIMTTIAIVCFCSKRNPPFTRTNNCVCAKDSACDVYKWSHKSHIYRNDSSASDDAFIELIVALPTLFKQYAVRGLPYVHGQISGATGSNCLGKWWSYGNFFLPFNLKAVLHSQFLLRFDTRFPLNNTKLDLLRNQ